MKTFIFTTTTKGRYATATIYRLKQNTPIPLGSTKWDMGSCKGANSEVYTFLYEQNEVSKKEYDTNGGYYSTSKIKIYSL